MHDDMTGRGATATEPAADALATTTGTTARLAATGDAAALAALERLATWAPNTRRAYERAWTRWTTWAAAHGVPALPADPVHVRDYLLARDADGKALATLRMDAAGIGAVHQAAQQPTPCPPRGLVAATLSRLAKADHHATRGQRQAAGLTADALAAIRATASTPRHGVRRSESPAQARARGLVDVAACLLISDAGLRRSEAAALTWGDIERVADGSGRVTIRRSKTDQAGAGAVVAVTREAMRALAAIRPADADPAAPVLGLSADRLARRVKAAARAAGLGDGFSGHSGRVGMARRMVGNGAPTAAVQRQGRWHSPAMVARYTRAEDAADALRYL